jgi:hypothetical protein
MMRCTSHAKESGYDWQLSNIARRRLGGRTNPDVLKLLTVSALSLLNERPRFRGMTRGGGVERY